MPLISRRLLIAGGTSAATILPAGAAAPRRAPRAPAPRLPLVMLDPGHGGKDPGAIGVSGTYEKQVVLSIALELRRLLLATRRYRVGMTRTRDVFIPLGGRVAAAQRAQAALFVSIHADAIDSAAIRGASVYTLSDAASDAQSAALAQRENRADRFSGPGFRDHPPEIARILASLVLRETRVGSARLQRTMVSELGRNLPMLQQPARHAGFVVLKAPDIPSVLVETGFMSNRQDEAALRKPAHRRKVAVAMQRAVDAWMKLHNQRAQAAL